MQCFLACSQFFCAGESMLAPMYFLQDFIRIPTEITVYDVTVWHSTWDVWLSLKTISGLSSSSGQTFLSWGMVDNSRMHRLFVDTVPTILVFPAKSSSARPTLVKNLSVVMLRPLRTKEEEKPPYPHQRTFINKATLMAEGNPFEYNKAIASALWQEMSASALTVLLSLIRIYPVVIFSQSNCRYCAEVNDIFQWYCLPRGSHITVQLDREERSRYFKEALHYLTGVKTVPQVFIGGQFIGDAEIIKRIHCNGVLQEMLNKLRLIQCNNGCQGYQASACNYLIV
ncbi:Glutaredoxin-2, mitochondrial [Trichinella spiralis]|uniref:Glutaredoxin-2, mitochondrial n=1 Tax=Trichinella spiralis TaxID=6334 RepID=A0A0V1B5C4_TRISP|nr:Glutaredoxin-2, mitochondrial [Trichinella spiralis]